MPFAHATQQEFLSVAVYALPETQTLLPAVTPEIDVNFTQPNSKKLSTTPKTKFVLVALTVSPPTGNYFYGMEETQGLPTKLSFAALPMDRSAIPLPVTVRLPEIIKKKESHFASTVLAGVEDSETYIFAGTATFVAKVAVRGPGITLKMGVSGLFCSDKHCMPFTEQLESAIAADTTTLPLASTAPWWEAYAAGKAVPINSVVAAASLETKAAAPSATPSAFFAPVVTPASSVPFIQNNATVVPLTTTTPVANVDNANAEEDSEAVKRDLAIINQLNIEPQYFSPALEVSNVWKALGLGLAAGLILNLMPCVLPVVSLKFSALLAVTAMTNKKDQAKAFRNHCLIFASGVLSWFLFLALMLGLAGWAWGELFQNPVALSILGMILFLLSLSLFGVFSLPIFDLKVATKSNPHWQAFASGLLATLLATPCSGPLLGGVIGWAIRQPLPLLVTTIMCIGIGMTIPYCVLAINPRFINLLPRPGAWTIRLEQLLGFFLLGSVVYLTVLLPRDWLAGYLTVLLSVAFAAWLWGQIGHLNASILRRTIAKSCAVLVIISAVWWAKLTITKDFNWQPFSAATFAQMMGNEVLLLEFTADWCPNCKILEQTTLSPERMADLRSKYKIKTLRVDLTKLDKAGFELLSALGSKTMPLIAIFPTGEKANKPIVLRDIVTPTQLEEAIESVYAQ